MKHYQKKTFNSDKMTLLRDVGWDSSSYIQSLNSEHSTCCLHVSDLTNESCEKTVETVDDRQDLNITYLSFYIFIL